MSRIGFRSRAFNPWHGRPARVRRRRLPGDGPCVGKTSGAAEAFRWAHGRGARATVWGGVVLIAASIALTGCRKIDMSEQKKVGTYEATPIFLDGTEARPLVGGTVPRNPTRVPGLPYNSTWAPGPAGASTRPSGTSIPPEIPISRQLIERGQERYNIYCYVCHGRLGDGNGMVVQRGFPRPPSFHNGRLNDPKQTPDSHFYDVISNGFGAMYSYAERVAPEDRWAIVAYIRTLQASVAANPAVAARAKGDRP